ncbi:SMI1/KNR4 family protein [Paenibacillus methanolicus]|uniref:SUKH superfamily protein n=1 Tax=Paenibacillus methanolicus TaxID=582686 RepID=A0A5S5C204_9BACL|nr:SMI1/KNR4 family protein [Paenibacillus methanolicus]TYP71993.1 SUKH superfamily protein [Paenibacillus methanolicus]
MWKNVVSNLSSDYQFSVPATEAELLEIEEKLNASLPEALLTLYQETNGIFGDYGISLVWSTERAIKENLYFRSLPETLDYLKPLDEFLFFSDAGNGDLFGYKLTNGNIQREDIYVWNHENDQRTVIASSLEEFITGWATGVISV